VGHVEMHVNDHNTYKILVRKTERKRPLGQHRRRW